MQISLVERTLIRKRNPLEPKIGGINPPQTQQEIENDL